MKPTTPFVKNPGVIRDTFPPRLPPDLLAESDAVNIQEQVQLLHDEQLQLINDPSPLQDPQTGGGNIEQEYKDAIEAAVAEKETQAENLENRLESLIDKQRAVLQQMMSRQPFVLALPGQKAKWQVQVQQQQSLLSRLQNRLETVKEIHVGMGLHGPRIHELATAKVRHEKTELAEGWDEMRAAQRAHDNRMRKQAKEKEQKDKLQRDQISSLGKIKGLSLSQKTAPP